MLGLQGRGGVWGRRGRGGRGAGGGSGGSLGLGVSVTLGLFLACSKEILSLQKKSSMNQSSHQSVS